MSSKNFLDFAESHGRIFFRRARGSDTKLYITDVEPCPEIENQSDGDVS